MGDDEDKRGQRDNTDREHKPEHAQDRENAPRGHLGTGPSLDLGGGGQRRQFTERSEQTQQERQEPTIDDRPIAPKTGDEEVDRQSEEQGHRLIPEDEFNERIKGEHGAVPSQDRQSSTISVEPDRPAETIGSASKPRDQEQVLKDAQDQQRETPDQALSPDQRRAALHEASAAVEKDQAALKEAWEREDDPKVKEQIALKAGIEQADFNRHAAGERADLAAEENGPQSIEALRAKRESREAEATYEQGVADWHKNSVRDSDYERYDDKWSREAERAEAREANSNETQAEKSEALTAQFNASSSMSHGHGR